MKPEHRKALEAKKEHWISKPGIGGGAESPSIEAGSDADMQRRIENQRKYKR